VLACAAALMVALLSPGAAGAAGWLRPHYVGGSGFGPMSLAVDDRGNTFMAWVGPGDELAIAKRPVGGNFETPQIIHVNAFEPQIGVDGAGNALVVWTSEADGGSVQQARRAANASQFTLGAPVDSATGVADGPRLDVNRAGAAVVGWDTITPQQARWALGSTTAAFGSPVAAGPTAGEPYKAFDVDINEAGDAGFAYTWNFNSMKFAYRARGGALGTEESIASGTLQSGPEIALDGQGRVVAVWATSGAGSEVQASFRPAGTTGPPPWTSPAVLDGNVAGGFGSVHVAFDQLGQAVATWGGGGQMRTKTRPAGNPPAQFPAGAPAFIGSSEQPFSSSLGSVVPGSIVSLWRRSSNFMIRASVRPPGGVFAKDDALTEGTHQGSSHAVAMASGGNGAGAWVDTDTLTNSVTMASSVYDATPPVITSVKVPATAIVGEPVQFSAGATDDWAHPPKIGWTVDGFFLATGNSFTHTFPGAGVRKITGFALDDGDNVTPFTRTITVKPDIPTRGIDFNASKVSGTVLVSVPKNAPAGRVLARPAVAHAAAAIKPPKGYRKFRRLGKNDNIPIGSILDATRGVSQVRMASNGSGTKTQLGKFSQGVFKTSQSRGSALTTAVMLGGGNFRRECRKFGFRFAKADASAAKKRRRPHRRLFSRVKGRFRTRGRHSSATTRGTEFLVKDECKGTTTRVLKGSVTVRDNVKKRTRIVRAPHSYLARSRKR
jgi:hypothetical protein